MTTFEDQLVAEFTAENGRAPSYHEQLNLLAQANAQDSLYTRAGQNIYTVATTDDLKLIVDNLEAQGGGIINLQAGTHTLSDDIFIQGKIQFIGIGEDSTFIDLSNGKVFEANNAGAYTTGTVTVAAGFAITGSGTAWLANAAAGMSLFLQSRWYRIASVTDDTHLVLSEYYSDNVTLPVAYRIQTTVDDIAIRDLNIINSTGNGLNFVDCRRVILENVHFVDNNVGLVLTNCSETFLTNVNISGSVGDGVQATNVGLSDWRSVTAIDNDGHGFTFSTVKTLTLTSGLSLSNTDGFHITTGIELNLSVDATNNSSQGIELVATCTNINIFNGRFGNNNSDGIKLTATATDVRIHGNYINSNGGFGVNIANANCTENNIINNTFFAGTSGPISDSGVDTIIFGNNATAGNQGVVNNSPITTRVTSQFDKTTNTTLANITGLSVSLLGLNSSKTGKFYSFEAVLYVDADATGGSKFAIAGTATATSIKYEIMLLDNTTSAYTITSRQTALAGSAGQAGTTAGLCIIKGTIVTNATGTLTVQFAQNASNGTSSVLVNSTFVVWETN